MNGKAPLRHNIYPESSSGRRGHNGWQCVWLRVPFLTLLLNLIRMANMTDDEEDSAVKPSRERNPPPPHTTPAFFFFKSHFYPLHGANFCSGIKLSVVSVAPRSGSKIRGRGREGAT